MEVRTPSPVEARTTRWVPRPRAWLWAAGASVAVHALALGALLAVRRPALEWPVAAAGPSRKPSLFRVGVWSPAVTPSSAGVEAGGGATVPSAGLSRPGERRVAGEDLGTAGEPAARDDAGGGAARDVVEHRSPEVAERSPAGAPEEARAPPGLAGTAPSARGDDGASSGGASTDAASSRVASTDASSAGVASADGAGTDGAGTDGAGTEASTTAAGGARGGAAAAGPRTRPGTGLDGAQGGGGSPGPDVVAAVHARLAAVADRCYPPAARRFQQRGTVGVRFCVDAAGGPGDAQVTQSSGASLLDGAVAGCVLPGAAPLPDVARGQCFTVPVRFGAAR